MKGILSGSLSQKRGCVLYTGAYYTQQNTVSCFIDLSIPGPEAQN